MDEKPNRVADGLFALAKAQRDTAKALENQAEALASTAKSQDLMARAAIRSLELQLKSVATTVALEKVLSQRLTEQTPS